MAYFEMKDKMAKRYNKMLRAFAQNQENPEFKHKAKASKKLSSAKNDF
jgi:hypothetical protein